MTFACASGLYDSTLSEDALMGGLYETTPLRTIPLRHGNLVLPFPRAARHNSI
jgi:hypothetical protein